LTLLAALGGFVALVCLWFAYFGRAEQLVVGHASGSDDPIRAIHLGNNVMYAVVIGLVVFAAGADLVIAHPGESQAGLGGVLLLGGPAVYVGAQAAFFLFTTRSDWPLRVIGAAVLGVGAAIAYWLPSMVVVALLVIVLLALAILLTREREETAPSADSIPEL
jgi:low temperature requirement protein LtrA